MLLFGWDVLDTKEAIRVKLLDVVITYRDSVSKRGTATAVDKVNRSNRLGPQGAYGERMDWRCHRQLFLLVSCPMEKVLRSAECVLVLHSSRVVHCELP